MNRRDLLKHLRQHRCRFVRGDMEQFMPKEIFPSSYVCDCGHESHFSENTVEEMKRLSWKRKVRLGDSSPPEHIIVFYRGKMVQIICPLNACQ